MARLYISDHSNYKHLYTVDKSVGIGGANSQDDVLLVQFFLRVAMEPAATSPAYIPPGTTKPIAIDGMYGKETRRYIKYFQVEGNRRNPGVPPTTTEGRIDPVVGGKMMGSISNTLYTIIALNVSYRTRRGAMIADIRKDPLFPLGLRPSICIE